MAPEIFQFIRGIDRAHRAMTEAEITDLTAKNNGGQGDWFSQWLASTTADGRPLNLRDLLNVTLLGKSYQVFAVADGISIIYDVNKDLNSVTRNLRFVVVAVPDSDEEVRGVSLSARTLFIVGTGNVAGKNATLQCASWDPNGVASGRGLFRFYERGSKGWAYFGNSFNAFTAGSVSNGAFEGHVGGALIMKELTRPWPHWYTQSNMANFNDSLGSTRDKASECDPHNVLYDTLFTSPHGHPFNKLGTAETLEPIIRVSVRKWYNSRYYSNLVANTHSAGAIKDWVSHILLSNGTNIAASETSTAQIKANKVDVGAPPITLFVNLNALQAVLPGVGRGVRWDFTVKNDVYNEAVKALQLSLYYDAEDSETFAPTRKLAVNLTEGPFAFPIIEPGIEDYQAVSVLATNSVRLLPKKAIAAMLMIDFWNPMYSVKRAKLMAYLPATATYDAPTKTYNFLDQFIEKVKASAESKTEGTPEFDILYMLGLRDDEWETGFTERVNTYLRAVQARLRGGAQKAAVIDYMVLAEGRRRLYKGWQNARDYGSGLDESRITLPIAARPDPFPLAEMTESGHIFVESRNVSVIDFTPTEDQINCVVARAGKCPVKH